MEVILKAEAQARGLIKFFTGKPCKNGHITQHYTRSGLCCECAALSAKRHAAKYPGLQFRRRTKQIRGNPQEWVKLIFAVTKYRAKKRGIPFDLTIDHLLTLIPADGFCPALHIPLIFYGGKINRNSASLDRIIPARGYVDGNVVIISSRANSIKQDVTDSDDLRMVADYIDSVIDENFYDPL